MTTIIRQRRNKERRYKYNNDNLLTTSPIQKDNS